MNVRGNLQLVPVLLVGLILPALGIPGCRLAPRIGVTETGAPEYDRAMVVYELNGLQRPLPLKSSEITPASYDSLLAAEDIEGTTSWTSATLSIEYPHPEGDLEMARATLRLSSQQPGTGGHGFDSGSGKLFGIDLLSARTLGGAASGSGDDSESGLPKGPDDEIWVLDFPRQQLDLLLLDLAGSGFFEEQLRDNSGARLDVQIDWGRTRKPWTSEPRLDDFVARVYREGRLGGFVPCLSHDG